MKIKETDFMWQCYKRAYKNEKFQNPVDFCHYFWFSCMGLISKLFWDSNYFIMLFLGTSIVFTFAFFIALIEYYFGVTVASPFASMAVILSLVIFIVAILRLVDWVVDLVSKLMEKRTFEKFFTWFWTATIVSMVLFITYSSLFIVRKEELLASFIALACVLGTGFLITIIIYPLASTEFFKAFIQYLSAKKKKICPIVEVPDQKD